MPDRKDLMSRMLSPKPEDRAHCRAQLAGHFESQSLADWIKVLELQICIEPVLNFEDAAASAVC